MKIQTFSVVVGGPSCNAKCPYCVSKLTGCTNGIIKGQRAMDINKRNFHIACNFAKQSGVSTVLLTGKGEPLLHLEHINRYLEMLQRHNFPFIELQTNGILLEKMDNAELIDWYNMGLTTVSLSCAHFYESCNKEIFGQDINLEENIKLLHRIGFSVRISCVMVDGMIDEVNSVHDFAEWCQDRGVEQFTVRPATNISIGEIGDDEVKKSVYRWILQNTVSERALKNIDNYFNNPENATTLLTLAHGAKVYDYDGQNISINSCLTHSTNPDDIRQLIFSSDGHLRYSWVHSGAIII